MELFLDIETFSSEDLKTGGVARYVESPDFEILLMSYAFDDEPVRMWDLTEQGEPEWLKPALLNPELTKIAHNGMSFERACFNKALGIYTPPEQWEDTMILCARNGLPLTLDAAGAALGLEQQKLKTGAALIRYFCQPCKPTKANGMRTRNRPEDAPEKWADFKEYGTIDTDVCRRIKRRLEGRVPVPKWERAVECLDARMNEGGVLVDTDMVKAAVAVDQAERAKNEAELRRLTGLDNPNSVAQLKGWLETVGLTVESLNKASLADLLETVTDPTTRRVVQLRQLMGKTSTKKYDAVLASVCSDGRIRGLLQYYGTRTGRWAGRRVQLQNLAQNHLANIATVRELVKQQDTETLELMFDSIPDVLSQLIRTSLIAGEGKTFLVADYSAIEARVIAYLAGEKWRQDVFAEGGDIYCSSASAMFKVPVVKHGINGHLRQKGKIAELACVAEGQKVLTDKGLVPIEHITTAHKVWDGESWVHHEGLVYRGKKEVISYGGLEATADHVVWAEIEGQQRPVRFIDAATCGARLIQTGAGECAIRLGEGNKSRETMERKVESLLCSHRVPGLRKSSMAGPRKPPIWKVERVPELFPAESCSALAGPEIYSRKTTVHKPEGRKLQKLRCARNKIPFSFRYRRLPIYDRNLRASGAEHGAGQDRRERKLRAWESSLGDAPRKLSKPKAVSKRVVTVYDLKNAGKNHRFTVSDVLVHNCGYGGGVKALQAFGADKMGLTAEEMETIVRQWREASPNICRFWRDVEKAAKAALTDRPGCGYRSILYAGVGFIKDTDGLRCKLPSGRVLTYWGARIEDDQIVFQAQNQTTRKWEKTSTWGGKLVENIVQAYARDCLAIAMLRLDAAGWKIRFHVHDEVIVEAPEGSRWEDVADIMGKPITWAPGLLLRGDGYDTKFYMKD